MRWNTVANKLVRRRFTSEFDKVLWIIRTFTRVLSHVQKEVNLEELFFGKVLNKRLTGAIINSCQHSVCVEALFIFMRM